MKKPCLHIVLSACLLMCICTVNTFAQNHYIKATALPVIVPPIFYQLTSQDRLNYTLTTGQPIKIKRDTFVYKLTTNDYRIYKEKEDQIIIPVKLINNSNDTLEYIGMQCSWWDIYLTNNPKIEIQPANDAWYKNGLTVITIAPKGSSVINVPIGCAKDLSKDTKFRIGMILQKYNGDKGQIYIPMQREDNTIWSNAISIP